MASTSCVGESARALACRDGKAAAHLKLVSIFAIFVTSVVGVSLPVILARLFQGRPTYDRVVLIVKCFAAGVILSTSLVHVLPDAFAALSDCHVVSHHPWKDFPFSGLLTLIGALLALLVDLTASSHVETRNHLIPNYTPISIGTTTQDSLKSSTAAVLPVSCHANEHEHEEQNIISIRSGGSGGGDHHQELMLKLKQRLVSQVLEIGIIFHSVIIGVTMGMSQNQCTIRPLVAALSFHQIFEGLGLGGCIAQAGFGIGTTSYMCFMFAVTTPMGIVVGMMVFSATGYDESSANALIMEGLLGSLSSGVLIYMALVDLVAVDFFHNKMMASAPFLKKASFIALTLGSFFMSILAIWA